MTSDFDIIVIGGGHAGIEASHICAMMGLKTALVTISFETIAQMSCNPAIGGLGKRTWPARWTLWAALCVWPPTIPDCSTAFSI